MALFNFFFLFCFNFLSSSTFCAFAKAIKAEDKTHDVDQSSVFRHLKVFFFFCFFSGVGGGEFNLFSCMAIPFFCLT